MKKAVIQNLARSMKITSGIFAATMTISTLTPVASLAILALENQEAHADSEHATAERIESLKESIISIARENQANLENFEEVRAELSPLVDELESLSSKSFEEKNQLKIGAWQQLWTDDADDLRGNNVFQTVDRSKTFQVVFDDGIFYNISEIQTALGRFTGFLKGSYVADEPRFILEFTDLQVRRGTTRSDSLFSFVESAKTGSLNGLFRIPGNQRYPNGPIGARGDIDTVFIDETLRIDKGQNFADGVSDLFVLVRTK